MKDTIRDAFRDLYTEYEIWCTQNDRMDLVKNIDCFWKWLLMGNFWHK